MATYVYKFTSVGNGVIRPFVNVKIINPHTRKSFQSRCLLDTGADKCLFPAHYAEMTGHDLLNNGCTFEFSSGINGDQLRTALHTFIIELYSEDWKTKIWKSLPIEVGCLEHNKTPPLLGYSGFLEHANIRFNYQTKKITIEI